MGTAMIKVEYNAALVTVSALIAMVAAYTSLEHVDRMKAATRITQQRVWLSIAAVVFGGGIWSMHFIGMVAFSLGIFQVQFDVALTVLSFIVPVIGVGFAYDILNRRRQRPWLLPAALVMAASIVSMHYIGMAAMQSSVHTNHDALYVVFAALIAFAASYAALKVGFTGKTIKHKLVAAILLGLAVSGMHYVAMAGMHTHLVETNEVMLNPVAQGLNNRLGKTQLAFAVSCVTFFLLLVSIIAGMSHDRVQRKKHDQQLMMLIHELNHRVKNTLMTVQSLAYNSLRDVPQAQKLSFEQRLISMAKAHQLLTVNSWNEVSLHSIIENELEVYTSDTGPFVVQKGPEVQVSPRVALALEMTIHELTTNAAKYGALSVPKGIVEIKWWHYDGNKVKLRWKEMNGPKVVEPSKLGFGSRLIRRTVAELDGDIEKRFDPDGIKCTIIFSLE